jgi:hypothetical protein
VKDPYDPTLLDGVQLATVELLNDADAQGWTRQTFLPGRGIRIWCNCTDDEHNAWIDITNDDPEYATRARTVMMNRTCWREKDPES